MKISRGFIIQNKTANGGFTTAQIMALGFPRHGCSGWIDAACQREYTQEQIDNFVKAKTVYIPYDGTKSKAINGRLDDLKIRLRKCLAQEKRLARSRKTIEAMIEEIERNEQMKGTLK